MLPVAVAPPAHHDEVARAGSNVDGTTARAWPEQERAGRAERDDRDEARVGLAELAIAVERDAVAPVAVVVEEHAAEDGVVAVLER